MKWYLMAFKRYADFDGRSRRKEYWMFQLFNTIIIMILYGYIISQIIGGSGNPEDIMTGSSLGLMSFFGIYFLATFVPSLAIAVRRLHDVGKSGWFLLWGLVPFGGLVIFYFSVVDSQEGSNEYGANPKNIGGEEVPLYE